MPAAIPPKTAGELEKGFQRFMYDAMVAAQSLSMFRAERAGVARYPHRCCEKIAGLIMARNLLQFLRGKRTPARHKRFPDDIFAADYGLSTWTGTGLTPREQDWCDRISKIAGHIVDKLPPAFDAPEFLQVMNYAIREARGFIKDCLAAGCVTVSNETAKFHCYLDGL